MTGTCASFHHLLTAFRERSSAVRENETICDPACGTGCFLLIAHEFIRNHNKLDKKQLNFLNTEQLRGVELVDSVARLCCMNLVLHGIGSDATHVPVMVKDALAGKHGEYEMVLTNPPIRKEEQRHDRQ
jgi:type I restriction enzyme M protein